MANTIDPQLQLVEDLASKPDGRNDEIEPLPLDKHEEAGPGDYAGREEGAPRYTVPPRAMGAVEIPMIVADVDRATRAFGNIGSFKAVSSY